MGTQVFPSSIIPNFSISKTPMWQTLVINYGGKSEQRIALNSVAQHKFVLNFNVLEYNPSTDIMAFYNARQGAYDSFFLAYPEESRNAALWSSSTTYSTGHIIRSTLSTLSGHSYICISATAINGGTVPTFTTVRNATFTDGGVVWKENSYKVRFETDEMNFEYFDYQLYSLGQISFLEVST